MEYDPRHDIEIPRAPAFHSKKSREVQKIVDRLMMRPKDRFNFIYPENKSAYNDWKTAREEKLRRLKETVHMFGGSLLSSRKHEQPEEQINSKGKETGRKKKKRQKKENRPTDFVNTLPDISESNV